LKGKIFESYMKRGRGQKGDDRWGRGAHAIGTRESSTVGRGEKNGPLFLEHGGEVILGKNDRKKKGKIWLKVKVFELPVRTTVQK